MPRVGIDELPALVRAIYGDYGEETPRRRAMTRAPLLFTLLTWARTNETRLTTWDELEGLDGPEPLWRVPAARMKMPREHLVPLSNAVVALLADVLRYSRGRYVFADDKPEQAISQNTLQEKATTCVPIDILRHFVATMTRVVGITYLGMKPARSVSPSAQ